MALPPVHRVDHPIEYIHSTDSAWDKDKIEYELAVIDGKREAEPGRPVPNGKRSDHPWVRFFVGDSRGDIRTVEDYLTHKDGALGPVRFRFERMPLTRWIACKNLDTPTTQGDRMVLAVRYSLVGAAGLELQGGRNGEPLTEGDITLLRRTFGDAVIEDLGFIAIKASSELADAEKKP
jgi:hypothetical protein